MSSLIRRLREADLLSSSLTQRHRIVSKAGAHFTLMVVGESGVGKTTCACCLARLTWVYAAPCSCSSPRTNSDQYPLLD